VAQCIFERNGHDNSTRRYTYLLYEDLVKPPRRDLRLLGEAIGLKMPTGSMEHPQRLTITNQVC